MFNQLGVIGCGLMGGSFALALKRAGLVKRVVGYSKSPSTTEQARRMGVIDQAAESALLAVSGSDIVLMAVPVAASETTFRSIRHLIGAHQLVMDVGSTKVNVVDAARRSLKEKLPFYVPAHPIAGREAGGVANADPDLYRGRQVILTPLPETERSLVQRATDVWSAVGSKVLTMTPENHDSAFAAISHLPHLLAFAYFNAIQEQAAGPDLLALAGPGFRDFTRIAASEPAIWRDILIANRTDIKAQLGHFRHALSAIEAAMDAGSPAALEDIIRHAAHARSNWQISGSRRGPDAAE